MSNILCAGDTFSYNLWVASCYEMWHCDAKLALCLAGLWHLPGKRSACGIYHAFWWAMAEWLILSLYWQLVLTTQPLTQALRQVVKVPTQWINHNRKSLLLPWRVSLWVLFLCLFGLRLGCGGPGAKADHCWSWSTGNISSNKCFNSLPRLHLAVFSAMYKGVNWPSCGFETMWEKIEILNCHHTKDNFLRPSVSQHGPGSESSPA